VSAQVERHSVTTPARTGVWVGIAAIVLMVAAFTGALVVRRGQSDWIHFRLPPIIYVNTLVLLVSSAALERARGGDLGAAQQRRWLSITLALGLLFVVGQVLAWSNLVAQGLFLATSPSSAFFYVLTALHGVHLLGGVAALAYVLGRARRAPLSDAAGALDAAALYWHFLAVLWLYLLLLLTLQL
jgi:cytochrome c oxidase subunit III